MDILGLLKTIGGGVAAPFTGGATLPIALSGLSDILGGAAKTGQTQNNTSDSLKLLLDNANLNQQKFAEAAPGQRLSTGMRAAIAGQASPATLNWGPGGFKPGAIAEGKAGLPTWEGGVSGALKNLPPDAKQLSNQVLHDELVSQLRGGETGGGQAAGSNGPGAPDLHGTDKTLPSGLNIGQPSTGDNILGGLGIGSSILSLLSKLQKPNGGSTDMSGLNGDGSGDWMNSGIG